MDTPQIRIFQYQAKQNYNRDNKKHLNYLQDKKDTQQTNINQNIEERVSAMEGKSVQEINEKNSTTLQVKGTEQHHKDHATKQANDIRKVEDLVRQSNRRIFSVSSAFPWSFFPNSIDIEESRLTFNFRQFLSYQSHSVDIKDITNIFIESGLFFCNIAGCVTNLYTKRYKNRVPEEKGSSSS